MGSKKVYLTESAFYTFIDRSDIKHQMAGAFFRYFAQDGYHLYTSPSTVMYTYEHIQTYMSQSIGRDFLQTLFTSAIDIVYVDEPMMKTAVKLVITTKSANLTLDQALSNIVCDRLQIPYVCTFKYFPYLFGLREFTLPY